MKQDKLNAEADKKDRELEMKEMESKDRMFIQFCQCRLTPINNLLTPYTDTVYIVAMESKDRGGKGDGHQY